MRYGALCALTTGALLRSPLAILGQDGTDPANDYQVPYEATTSPVFYFKRETFEPYVGSYFLAQGAEGKRVQLKLVEIHDYAPDADTQLTTTPHRQTNSFSLHFRSSAQLRQTTSIHTLEHGALGKFDLFLTQSTERNTWFYQAVINHPAN